MNNSWIKFCLWIFPIAKSKTLVCLFIGQYSNFVPGRNMAMSPVWHISRFHGSCFVSHLALTLTQSLYHLDEIYWRIIHICPELAIQLHGNNTGKIHNLFWSLVSQLRVQDIVLLAEWIQHVSKKYAETGRLLFTIITHHSPFIPSPAFWWSGKDHKMAVPVPTFFVDHAPDISMSEFPSNLGKSWTRTMPQELGH